MIKITSYTIQDSNLLIDTDRIDGYEVPLSDFNEWLTTFGNMRGETLYNFNLLAQEVDNRPMLEELGKFMEQNKAEYNCHVAQVEMLDAINEIGNDALQLKIGKLIDTYRNTIFERVKQIYA